MGLLRELFGPSKDEVWRQLADKTGASFVDGGFWRDSKVQATVKQWTVTLDTYTVSSNKHRVTYTRMRAPFVNRDGFRFAFYRAGFFSELGKFLGMQDVEVGDAEFDRDFVVKANDETRVRMLLANPEIRRLAQNQPSFSLQVKDDEGWFGASFPEGVDELHFAVVGVIRDANRLAGLFDLFATALDELCRIGSAYEDAPGVAL